MYKELFLKCYEFFFRGSWIYWLFYMVIIYLTFWLATNNLFVNCVAMLTLYTAQDFGACSFFYVNAKSILSRISRPHLFNKKNAV